MAGVCRRGGGWTEGEEDVLWELPLRKDQVYGAVEGAGGVGGDELQLQFMRGGEC